jgi:hypothetical protein
MSRSSLPVSVFLVMAAASVSAQTGWAPEDSSLVPVELPARPVAAQPTPEDELPPAAATPERSPVADVMPAFSAVDDSLTVLVEYRAEAEIKRELQNAVVEKALADRHVERARLLEKLAASRIDLKTSEIKTLEAQISFAKAEKNGSRQSELEQRRRFADREKHLLGERRDLRRREIETARAVRAYHEATEKALQLELDLAISRRDRVAGLGGIESGAAAESTRRQLEITKLEGRVLQAQIEQADKRKTLADQEVRLGKARRAVYESQLRVLQGGR